MEKRYYIAYGSNLNIPQMRMRCPGARIIGTSVVEGYRLLFKGSKTGSYLTIEPQEGACVPVAAWEVSAENEAALDRYEGFPTFYYKKEMELPLKGIRTGKIRKRKVFVYIMHENRPLGIPTEFYMETCRQGYRSFGFDEAFLERAYADSAAGEAREFPGGWKAGDSCYLVTNREKGCTGAYTVRGFDGKYFCLENRRGSRCRASEGRMFRSREQSSYEAQVDYYTNYINGREDWEFVSVYADEGITGCNTKKRDGFNKMVEDALSGGIDLIITKSVSRFARNTVDSLTTIRKLKENRVECYFEKENIWTFDGKGELLLTIMSSLAQEESRSISENCTWGQRKRFADGKVTVPFKRFLGYDRGEDGNLVINEEQAETVRRIYGLFLQGRSPHAIAKLLMAEGIPSPGGKEVWSSSTVKSILTNEKYKGDALLQKVYTVDFLSKKKKVNEGEVPQYYVENNHQAIISPSVFEEAQHQMATRHSGKNRASCTGIFSSRIKCGDCGGWYGSKVWHSNSKYRSTIWQCNHKFDGGEKCGTPHLDEETIKSLFLKAVNAIFAEKDGVREDYDSIKDTLFGTSELEAERLRLQEEMNVAAELIGQCVAENARVAFDQTEYQKKYDGLAERFNGAKARLEKVGSAITERQAKREKIGRFVSCLEQMDGPLTEFNEDDWYSLVDYATVYSREDIRFTFKNGMEIMV